MQPGGNGKFDLLRRKAEGRMRPGGNFPEASVDVLCLLNARLLRREQSLVLGQHVWACENTENWKAEASFVLPYWERGQKGRFVGG